jgi:hypothetical protein
VQLGVLVLVGVDRLALLAALRVERDDPLHDAVRVGVDLLGALDALLEQRDGVELAVVVRVGLARTIVLPSAAKRVITSGFPFASVSSSTRVRCSPSKKIDTSNLPSWLVSCSSETLTPSAEKCARVSTWPSRFASISTRST